MKYLVLSDLHADFNFDLFNKRHQNDWSTEQAKETFQKWWDLKKLPQTDGLISAGDFTNDFRSFKQIIDFIQDKYKEIIITLGNHDLVVKGGTCSGSNTNFKTSEEKIQAMKDYVAKYPHIHLLEGDTYGPFAGCMGMCDFKAEVMPGYEHSMSLVWRNWFDGAHWRYFEQHPLEIWEHYDKLMTDLVAKHPKVMITHFCPIELGVAAEYRNNMYNPMFYFNGKKYLDELDDGAIWICGHIHQFAETDYVNAKGNHIKIMARPHGYPGENSLFGFIWDYNDGGYKSNKFTYEDCIIDI